MSKGVKNIKQCEFSEEKCPFSCDTHLTSGRKSV